jgi:Leucine-rich repeat (LRR) protein
MFSQEKFEVFYDLDLALENADGVKYLDLSNKKLETLPAAVLKFKNLEYLNLSGNPISHLPIYIAELKNLQILDLSFIPNLNMQDAFEKIKGLNLKALDIKQSGLFENQTSITNQQVSHSHTQTGENL